MLHKDNLPELYKDVKLGSGPPDRGLFDQEIFEVGAPVAVIAAESEHIADEATRMIEVQYEVLPAALDMLEAMKASTPTCCTCASNSGVGPNVVWSTTRATSGATVAA